MLSRLPLKRQQLGSCHLPSNHLAGANPFPRLSSLAWPFNPSSGHQHVVSRERNTSAGLRWSSSTSKSCYHLPNQPQHSAQPHATQFSGGSSAGDLSSSSSSSADHLRRTNEHQQHDSQPQQNQQERLRSASRQEHQLLHDGVEEVSNQENQAQGPLTPNINPRSLVQYLDTYVIGQTKAKKVLAVGVWNHYVRVANNLNLARRERAREAMEELRKKLEGQQQRERDTPAPIRSADHKIKDRELRLGRIRDVEHSWEMENERISENVRDPFGEDARRLNFGRREREWLWNASSPEFPSPSHPGGGRRPSSASHKDGNDGATEKWGSSESGRKHDSHRTPRTMERVGTHPPASTATPGPTGSKAYMERKCGDSAANADDTTRELTEAAKRLHRDVLSDYECQVMGATSAKADQPDASHAKTSPTSGGDTYFTSYTPDKESSASEDNPTSQVPPRSKSGHRGGSYQALSSKFASLSAEGRAAAEKKSAEDRTRRALEAANSRLDPSYHKPIASPSTYSSPQTEQEQAVPPQVAPLSVPYDTTHSSIPISSASPGSLPFFEKSNLMLLGPTGSGKTLLLRTLAQALNVPFIHLDATPFTMAGYVGEDVESIVHRLMVESNWDVSRAQMGIVVIDEVDKLAKRSAGGGGEGGGGSSGKDVSGEGVQQALLRILEGTVISVTDKSGSNDKSGGGIANEGWWNSKGGPGGRKGSAAHGLAASNAGGGMPSTTGQGTTYHVDTSSILFVLSGAFVGLEKIISDRLAKESSMKAAKEKGRKTAEEGATNGVLDQQMEKEDLDQNKKDDLYEQAEPIDLQNYGLIPEFIGRIPVMASLRSLTTDDLIRVLKEPKNALLSQYKSLFSASKVEFGITSKAIRSIASQAVDKGTGARGLRRILESRLLDAFYSSPDSSVKYVLLDKKAADGKGEVKLFSRGGKVTFESCLREEEEEEEAGEEEETQDGLPKALGGGAQRSAQEGRKVVAPTSPAVKRPHSRDSGTEVNLKGGERDKLLSSSSSSSISSTTRSPPAHFSPLQGNSLSRTETLVRRKARARLTRPTRVGNLRVHYYDRSLR